MILNGTLRLSDPGVKRTNGNFNKLIRENAAVFRRYFGVDLFHGSLNVDVLQPPSLQADLDGGRPSPAFVIPRTELVGMPPYIGDGQAWPCVLTGARFPQPINCWVFRRMGSRVPRGVIEIVAAGEALRSTYGLQHADKVVLDLLAPHAP